MALWVKVAASRTGSLIAGRGGRPDWMEDEVQGVRDDGGGIYGSLLSEYTSLDTAVVRLGGLIVAFWDLTKHCLSRDFCSFLHLDNVSSSKSPP